MGHLYIYVFNFFYYVSFDPPYLQSAVAFKVTTFLNSLFFLVHSLQNSFIDSSQCLVAHLCPHYPFYPHIVSVSSMFMMYTFEVKSCIISQMC